jgi:phosphoglycolate phosphatase-like HAD superfamily hydrolase
MAILLFDIDMTLIDTKGSGRAALELACKELFGVDGALADIGFAGRTDRYILQEALRRQGLLDDGFDEMLPGFIDVYVRHLTDVLPTRAGTVLPGAREVVERLAANPNARLGVATGNFRRSAAVKLEHFGLSEILGDGGYGDDHLDRANLVREAARLLSRAGGGGRTDSRAPEPVIVIGDTPFDVQAAKEHGYVAVAVATGFHSVDELHDAGADTVLADMADVDATIGALEVR